MKHENIYSTFYYEACFHSSIKKSYSVKVSYCLNFDIGEMNVVLMYQANTQCCDDVVVRPQRRTTDKQLCTNVDATSTKLQRCANVASTLNSNFSSKHTIDVVMATLIHRVNHNVKFTASSQPRYYDVAPALCKLCKKPQIWTIPCHMVTFPQRFLKVVKKFYSDMIFFWYIVTSISGQYFLLILWKFHKSYFRKV